MGDFQQPAANGRTRFEEDYSSRRVIKTAAARRTPNASKPVLICPNAILIKVVANVAPPIKKGIGRFRSLDLAYSRD